ncbi:MAG: alpha/beta hydrolase [Christensenellales bacterium]
MKEEGPPRPDGSSLCYPVITAGKYAHADSIRHLAGDSEIIIGRFEKHVTQDTPPTFIWHTVTDETVPMQNSILFTESLAEKGVPVELHSYPNGKHGLSLATKEVEECEKDASQMRML